MTSFLQLLVFVADTKAMISLGEGTIAHDGYPQPIKDRRLQDLVVGCKDVSDLDAMCKDASGELCLRKVAYGAEEGGNDGKCRGGWSLQGCVFPKKAYGQTDDVEQFSGIISPKACQLKCAETTECNSFTWVAAGRKIPSTPPRCFLKSGIIVEAKLKDVNGAVTGPKECGSSSPHSPSPNPSSSGTEKKDSNTALYVGLGVAGITLLGAGGAGLAYWWYNVGQRSNRKDRMRRRQKKPRSLFARKGR